MRFTRKTATGLALVGALALAGCAESGGTPAEDAAQSNSENAAQSGEANPSSGTQYPLTVNNCGTEVTFTQAPERVLLLESAPVTVLSGIGVFDKVVARAGSYPAGYYTPELAEQVEQVPVLTEAMDAAGHLEISQEEIIALDPDLVLGLPGGVSRETLADAGINLLMQELYCPNSPVEATFGTLYDQVSLFGEVFDRVEAADELNEDLAEQVAAVTDQHQVPDGEKLTAAFLYPTIGGGTTYAYGRGSMAQPQMEALGLENVFGDQSERVFEVQAEQIIAKDPDVIVLLYQGTGEGIIETITALPGADQISAVANDRVFTQLFNFTEPSSPLTVEGLGMLSADLHETTKAD